MKTSKILAFLTAVFSGCTLAAQSQTEGAKSLFLQQMDRPEESLNLGVQYWIELHRGDKVVRVNNKMSFQSGDKIRFHVKPNVNGYAYILLRSGSRGEQSVLFPDPARVESNKVVSGADYTLPATDFLQFDENPGLEKLTLLISRTPVDATAYLSTPDSDRILIASAATGSKDLVPSRIVLAIAPAPQPIASHALVQTAKPAAPAGSAVGSARSSRAAKAGKVAGRKPSKKLAASRVPSSAQAVPAVPAAPQKQQVSPGGDVTVVKRDPGGILAVDIALEHL